MSEFIALLPMKFHSERVPGKNFKDFSGRPLFEWMLDTLINVPQVSKVVINTDAVEHLLSYPICQDPKVQVRQRKPEICGDFVSMNKVLEDDIAFFGTGNYLMTLTTNPLLSAPTLSNAIKEYTKAVAAGHDSLFSCNEYYARFYDSKLNPLNHDPQNLVRTQDLAPLYEENSCLYLFSAASFEKTKARIGEKPAVFVTPPLESVDIDDEKDWIQAEINQKLLSN